MKKIMILAASSLIALSVSAQSAGEFRLGGSVAYISSSETIADVKQGTTSALSITPEAEFFITNNLSVSLGIGYDYIKTPELNEAIILNSTSSRFTIMPAVSYYVKLGDKFYYNPQFYVGFGFGSENVETDFSDNKIESVKNSINAFTVGLTLVSFEYRIAKNFALGFSCGDLNYKSTTKKVKILNHTIKSISNDMGLNINATPELSFKYIF